MKSPLTAAWTLFLTPNPTGSALVIAKEPSASVFLLSEFFGEVDVCLEDSVDWLAARDFYGTFCSNVFVFPWLDLEKKARKKTYCSIAFENALTTFGPSRARRLILGPLGSQAAHCQYAVIAKNPLGAGVLPERMHLKPRNTQKLFTDDHGLSQATSARYLHSLGARNVNQYPLYPNSVAPREILGPWAGVPQKKRGLLANWLEDVGLMQRLQNGYLSVGTTIGSVDKPVIDSILDLARNAWGRHDPLKISWLRCLGTGSLIAGLESSREEKAFLKIALSEGANRSARKHRDSISEAVRLFPWMGRFVSKQLLEGEYLGIGFLLESFIPGVPGLDLVRSPAAVDGMCNEIVLFLRKLFEHSAVETRVDSPFFDSQVTDHVSKIEGVLGESAELQRLCRQLRDDLVGLSLWTSYSHGDLNLKNVMFDESDLSLSGVVDWDNSCDRQFPLGDLADFLISVIRYRDGVSYGAAMLNLAAGISLNEREIFESYCRELDLSTELGTSMLAVFWLRDLKDALLYLQRPLNLEEERVNVARIATAMSEILPPGRREHVRETCNVHGN